MGPRLLSLRIADSADAWAGAGFVVDRSDDQPRIWLGGVALEFSAVVPKNSDREASGIVGWHIADTADGGAMAGLTATAPPPSPPSDPPPHPNAVTAIDHVVVAAPDLVAAENAFADAGVVARGRRDTTAGGRPMRQVFFVAETAVIEMIGAPNSNDPNPADLELSESGATATTEPTNPTGPASPEDAARFWGLALVTSDMAGSAAVLGEGLGSPKAAVQPGRSIATLRHRHFGLSVRTALMTPRAPGQA